MNDKKIITPERKNAKIVGMDNKPIESAQEPLNEHKPTQERVAEALHQLANQIETGAVDPEFVVVIPKMRNGEVPLVYMGEPIPTLILEGVLHKMLVRMALQ